MSALGAFVLVASTLAASTVFVAPAQAAPGDPFSAADPLVFIAQGSPTRLFLSTVNTNGDVVFTPEGEASTVSYNAISYNPANNYLYGFVTIGTTALPTGSLIRIGQGGVVTRVGNGVISNGLNTGAFGPDGFLYAVSGSSTTTYVVNVNTGAVVRTLALTPQAPQISDWTFANGFFWGITNSQNGGTPQMVRTNPTTGVVTRFPAPAGIPGDAFGAAWTFGNGNLGFSANGSGTVYQISVANPASATPTFTRVATSAGPASSNNDGASSPGSPTDLSIVKTGPASLVPGGTATYRVTVTNNGAGNSSGFVVNDTVPASLTGVSSPDASCTVTGNAVRCAGGRILVGQSLSYTITASVPANASGTVTNTATVTANEQDPTLGNNTSTTTAGIARISLVKNAGTPVDVNNNGRTDAGDTIAYTFAVTNNGAVALSAVTVNDPKVGAINCPTSSLAAGATQTCAPAAPYTVTAADVTSGSVINTATVSGTTPDGARITSEPSTTTTPTPAPAISIVKTPSTDVVTAAGQNIGYSFLVTNTGNVALSGVTVVEQAFSGTGTRPGVSCPGFSGFLTPGGSITCTAAYVTTQADIDAGRITNSATASGTPPTGARVTATGTAVVSARPDPQPDAVTVLQGESITFNVLTNDSAAATGATFSRAQLSPSPLQIGGAAAPAPASPTQGSVSCIDSGPDRGTCTYQSLDYFTGEDGFDYSLRQASGGWNQTWNVHVTITVLPKNHAPVVRDDRAVATAGGPAVTINPLANDTDIDAGDELSISAVTPPTDMFGTFTCEATECTYTPEKSDTTGPIEISYTVSDNSTLSPGALSASGTITIFVDPPALNPRGFHDYTGADQPVSIGDWSESTIVSAPTATCTANRPATTVSWQARTGTTGWVLERRLDGANSDWVTVEYLRGSTTTYTDTRVGEGRSYQYRVRPDLHRWTGTFSPVSSPVVLPAATSAIGC